MNILEYLVDNAASMFRTRLNEIKMEVSDYIDHNLRRIERRIMKTVTSAFFMVVFAVFLTFAIYFSLVDYLSTGRALAALIISVLCLIGWVIMKIKN